MKRNSVETLPQLAYNESLPSPREKAAIIGNDIKKTNFQLGQQPIQYATTSFVDQQQFLKLQRNEDQPTTFKSFNEHMKTNF